MDGIDYLVYVLLAIQKKGMFVNSKWKIHEKAPDEREKAESYKIARSLKKEALRIGWKVLANPEAKDCIKNCLVKICKQNKWLFYTSLSDASGSSSPQ